MAGGRGSKPLQPVPGKAPKVSPVTLEAPRARLSARAESGNPAPTGGAVSPPGSQAPASAGDLPAPVGLTGGRRLEYGPFRKSVHGHVRRGVKVLEPDEGRGGGDMQQRKAQAREEALEDQVHTEGQPQDQVEGALH